MDEPIVPFFIFLILRDDEIRKRRKIDMTEEINENGVTEPSHFSAKDTLKVGAK